MTSVQILSAILAGTNFLLIGGSRRSASVRSRFATTSMGSSRRLSTSVGLECQILLPSISRGGGRRSLTEGLLDREGHPLHQLRWSPSPANAGEEITDCAVHSA